MITPSRIVVQYGSRFHADCSSCVNGSCKETKWETPTGSKETLNNSNNGINKTRWNVDHATEWDIKPMCYEDTNADCCTVLAFTLYSKLYHHAGGNLSQAGRNSNCYGGRLKSSGFLKKNKGHRCISCLSRGSPCPLNSLPF